MTSLFRSERYFHIWDYSVSHSQLLIRSARDERDDSSDNIDLIFSAVFYVELPTRLYGLAIENADSRDFQHVSKLMMDQNRGDRLFCVLTGECRYHIGARHFKVFTNRLHPAESSLDFPKGGP